MVVTTPVGGEPKDPTLKDAMCVTSVTGGEETNPLWTSQVDDASFRKALETSLNAQGLLAGSADACTYELRANLLGLNQPGMGFDMTVGSNVNYEVMHKGNETPYFIRSQSASHTATVSDAFLGFERLRLANEGSIRKNIQQFIAALLDHQPG